MGILRKLTITADDFGMDSPTNRAVVYAFKNGWLSGAGIMPTGNKYEEAVRLAKKHKIPVGVHVAVTSKTALIGKPLTGIPSLTDGNTLANKLVATPDEVACEAGTQIYRVWRDGLNPVYWDSHRFSLPGQIYGPMVSEISRAACLRFVDYSKGGLPTEKFPRIIGSGSIMPRGVMTQENTVEFLRGLKSGDGWTWVHISTRGPRKQWLEAMGEHLEDELKNARVEVVAL